MNYSLFVCALVLMIIGATLIHIGLGVIAVGILLAVHAAVSEIKRESKPHKSSDAFRHLGG